MSSNPTGPLHVGHARNAALGDGIAALLESQGASVTREYYFNDAGRQMDILGASVHARYRQLRDPGFPFPEEGYQGEYIADLAREFAAERGDAFHDEPLEATRTEVPYAPDPGLARKRTPRRPPRVGVDVQQALFPIAR